MFGDGGVGKSYLALALALAGLLARPLSARWRVAPLRRVLYLDWESGRDEQQARLWRLTRGLGSTPVDGPAKGQAVREQWETMLDTWYAEVGYERKSGRPWPKTLRALGLDWLARDLWGKKA